jgi:hypothetical protein
MKRPTRKQAYELALVIMRGVNAVTVWFIFAVLLVGALDGDF